jgi:hypothetical protein
MEHATFWEIIQTANDSAQGNQDTQIDLIREALLQLPPEEIYDFDRIMLDYHALSFRRDLWAAAYIINGGCSDDGFEYFRLWLIGQGQKVFEAALQKPESLVEILLMPPLVNEPYLDLALEPLAYVARSAYESKTGSEMPLPPLPTRLALEVTGPEWSDDNVDEIFPELSKISKNWGASE